MSSEHVDQSLLRVDRPASPDGPRRPRLLIFDVNETLSDMAPMAKRFEDVGAPAYLATTWFAGLLRDGFALTSVDSSDSFAHIAAESLRVGLHDVPLNRGAADAVCHRHGWVRRTSRACRRPRRHRGTGWSRDPVGDPQQRFGLRRRGTVRPAGIREYFERLLTVEDAGRWKPAPVAYSYALQECGVDPEDAMLVAVHPWDIDGASRAGLATAWVNRPGGPYPEYFIAPELRAVSLIDLADQLR